ncbi:MAG TPA: hypothetical protein VGB22_07375 [candidate division Zixibacteria bacterium]|jgi:hypothetical protein
MRCADNNQGVPATGGSDYEPGSAWPGGAWSRAIVMLAVLVVSPIKLSLAQDTTGPDLQIGGHLDVQAVGRDAALGRNDFSVGQLTFDVSSQFNRQWAGAVQVAYDLDEEFVIDEAYVNWTVFDWPEGVPRRDPAGITHAAFRIGQFDVPVGLDWRVYSSFDRKLVSVPVVVANTHRGWNDVGVEFYGRTTWSNWSISAVNGFGTSPALRLPIREPTPLTAENDALGAIVPTEAFGARFGLVMNANFEFGTSYAAGYTDDDRLAERFWIFDLTAQFEHLELKGEFISHEHDRMSDRQTDVGYYMQGAWTHGALYGVVRLDAYRPEGSEVYPLGIMADETLMCGSFGGGYRVHRFAHVRAEYQLAEGSSNDMVYLQTAIAF